MVYFQMNMNNIKKLKFKLNIKILISHIFGIVALLSFTHLAISYSSEEFELPFYDRTKNTDVQIAYEFSPYDRTSDIDEEEEPTQEITNVGMVIDPDDLVDIADIETENPDIAPNGNLDAAAAADSADTFEVYSNAMRRQGYNVTDGVYEQYDEVRINNEINRYKTEVNRILKEYEDSRKSEEDGEIEKNEETGEDEPPVLPPAPLLYEYKLVKTAPEIEIPKSEKMWIQANYTNKMTVEPFMDYIIVRDNEAEILCDATGKVITKNFAALGVEILKMRDTEGRTVFQKTDDGVYYIYDPAAGEHGLGAFVAIAFSQGLTGRRGVPFMYPSYYGADGANGLDRDYNPRNAKWGYKIAGTETPVISRIYGMTFNFSENVGIAYQEASGRGDKFLFLDEHGNNYLDIRYSYFAPDTDTVTEEHLGFFYFDHGLTRVYERERDPRSFNYIEREFIVDYYGRPFYIPDDYTIKAYSNGMILLEKRGYYGFMNYLGEWVAQPIYRYAQPFYEGVAVIGLENGKKALIDTKGNLLTKFKYNTITNCTGGIIALFERNEGWTILNKVRKQVEIEIETGN